MISASASVLMNWRKIEELTQAQITALEKTTEALHTEIVQAQVIPFDQGHLQNDSTFPDYSDSSNGHTEIISSTPYARRLYFHPEYKFQKTNNPHAKGKWLNDWIDGPQRDFAQKAFAKLYKEISDL